LEDDVIVMLLGKYMPEDWEPSTIWYLIAVGLLFDAVVLGILASLIKNVVFNG